MARASLIVISLLLVAFFSKAQDRILLMNGQQLECRILSDTNVVLNFEITKKNGKTKVKEIHKNDVFSYQFNGRPEIILYAQDEMIGDIYTEKEMRMYMAGSRDARENYNAWPTGIAGFVICGATGYYFGDGVITTIVPPLAYTCVQFIPRIKIREKTMSDPGYKYNDIYADGYEPPARSRKIQSALKGGFAGSAAGVLLFLALK